MLVKAKAIVFTHKIDNNLFAFLWVPSTLPPVPLIPSAFRSPCLHIKHQTSDIKPRRVRGQKVMLDTDLAELYRVPTKSLNLAVKRNADRFPEDFTFQLTDDEAAEHGAL